MGVLVDHFTIFGGLAVESIYILLFVLDSRFIMLNQLDEVLVMIDALFRSHGILSIQFLSKAGDKGKLVPEGPFIRIIRDDGLHISLRFARHNSSRSILQIQSNLICRAIAFYRVRKRH